MGFRQVLHYMFPYVKPIARFPRIIALSEDTRRASRDEIILMELGVARTPKEARRLMVKHRAKHAQDVIDALPVKRWATFRSRLKTVLMRIEGTSYHDPLKEKPSGKAHYRINYVAKESKRG